MNGQTDMFTWSGPGTSARARRDDPQTAKTAAAAFITNNVERAIWEALATPGTIYEVSQILCDRWPATTISPRFRPMARAKLITETGETRKNPDTGRHAIVWRRKAKVV